MALTTFDQHAQQIGVTAAKLYLEHVRGKSRSGIRRELIAADLMVRGSTRAIR